MTQINRSELEALDASDPLATYKHEFIIPDDVIYLDGNSLGALPRATIDRMKQVVELEWGQGLIRSWNDAEWVEAPRRVGRKIAKLIGAKDTEVIVGDSTSVNFFKLVTASLALNPERTTILTECGNFPTDHYVLQGIQKFLGNRVEILALEREDIIAAINTDTLLVALTHVHYKTGEIFDMAEVTALAHDNGAYALWDLCHTAGAMPIDLNSCVVDFAVGCGYKYLNGGPGAPAFVYVADRHQDKAQQPLTGWFGHKNPFAFDDTYDAAPGIDQYQVGTPAVLGLAALEVGVDLFAAVDMDALREKSVRLCQTFVRLVSERCANQGFKLISPTHSNSRGSQISFAHENGYQIMQALINKGVIGDFRAPDIMRFGFAPLYLSYIDVWNAVEILESIITTGEWQKPEFNIRSKVT